jgi:16S rRNA (cytosine967-C5)-methyltransferase
LKKSSLIGHVLELHEAIRSARYPPDNTVREFVRAHHYLGARDRRFVTESLYGMVRHQRLLQTYAEQAARVSDRALPPQDAHSLALYAAYALRMGKENPDEVARDTGGLFRSTWPDLELGAFLNALSSVSLPPGTRDDPVTRIATMSSFPDFMVREWLSRFGEEETERLCAALNAPAPTTIRVNTFKCTVSECQRELQREGIEAHRTELSPYGLILEKRINVQALTAFKQGYFEMQDEGSQLIAMLVDPSDHDVVVDACAGGGGKSLHLSALMQNRGTMIAIDAEGKKLVNLHSRAGRAGVSFAALLVAGRDEAAIAQWRSRADRVLVDAPCTGSGTVRRNPWLKMKITEESVERMVAAQRAILNDYASLVKVGGRLVYTTCSLLEKENGGNVSWFLNNHPEFSSVDVREILARQNIGIDETSPSLTLLPHRTSTDGFFAAVMRRGN